IRDMREKNLRLELADVKDNIITSDEAVEKEFKIRKPYFKDNIITSDEVVEKEFKIRKPYFKIVLTPSQRSQPLRVPKVIKNALVAMIAVCEYKSFGELSAVKDELNDFQELFKKNLNYEFVHNEELYIDAKKIEDFTDNVAKQLGENKNQYDAL
ncbi:hypothetical protein RFI_02910, partial [Reticulomyxa filosa]